MVQRVTLAALVLLGAASCTRMQMLSKSTYDHQMRASELSAHGQYEAAAAERAAAQRDRLKMARIGHSADPPFPRL